MANDISQSWVGFWSSSLLRLVSDCGPVKANINYQLNRYLNIKAMGIQIEANQRKFMTSEKIYDKTSFNFPIVNFPFIRSKIPTSPSYGLEYIYISVGPIF